MDPFFIGLIYGVPGMSKTSLAASFLPNAYVLGKPSATSGVSLSNFSFEMPCWPSVNVESFPDCVFLQLIFGKYKEEFKPLLATLSNKENPKARMTKLPRTISALSDLIEVVAFLTDMCKAAQPLIEKYKIRPQFIIDDIQNFVDGSITQHKDLAVEKKYGMVKDNNTEFRTKLLQLATYSDIMITAHENPNGRDRKTDKPYSGGPKIGSKTEQGLIGDAEFALRITTPPNSAPWFDPFDNLNGGYQQIIQSVGATPDYTFKNRWHHRGILGPSLRAMAIASDRSSLCFRPSGLEWLDNIMYAYCDKLLELSSGVPMITPDVANKAYDYFINQANIRSFVPAGIEAKIPSSQSPQVALMNWYRWACQEGHVLAVYRKKAANLAAQNAGLFA